MQSRDFLMSVFNFQYTLYDKIDLSNVNGVFGALGETRQEFLLAENTGVPPTRIR